MDIVGWFGVGTLTTLVVGAQLWGVRGDRKRAASARAWAKSVGLAELPYGKEGVPLDHFLRRRRNIPSFVGALDGRKVSVIASSTRPRLGDLWALCTHAPRPPLFLGNRFGFGAANLFGQAIPRGWSRIKALPDLDRGFIVAMPSATDTPVLSEDAQAALLAAGVHAWCVTATAGGLVVLWFKQTSGQDTHDALEQARRLLSRLLA